MVTTFVRLHFALFALLPSSPSNFRTHTNAYTKTSIDSLCHLRPLHINSPQSSTAGVAKREKAWAKDRNKLQKEAPRAKLKVRVGENVGRHNFGTRVANYHAPLNGGRQTYRIIIHCHEVPRVRHGVHKEVGNCANDGENVERQSKNLNHQGRGKAGRSAAENERAKRR